MIITRLLLHHRRLPRLQNHRFFTTASSPSSQTQKNGDPIASATLRQLLSSISDLCPETVRRLRRASILKPVDVFELLSGSQHGCKSGNRAIEAGKVRFLFEIFNRAENQHRGFVHFPTAYQAMASMLVRAGLFTQAETVFSEMGARGVLLDCYEIVSDLILGYLGVGDVDRAVFVYEKELKARGLLPSISCCDGLLSHLILRKDTSLVLQICVDALERGIKLNDAEGGVYNDVIRLLCRDGKIQDARNVVKEGVALGLEPSAAVLNEVCTGYCEQANFEDALGLFSDIKRTPSAEAGNKILHSFCKKFGVVGSDSVLEELQCLGFFPDAVTYGILFGWSCHNGNLKSAMSWLSELFSRGFEPHVWSYNTFLAALFKEDMWEQAQSVYIEMVEKGIKANIMTFKVLLAGYCKARQFEEVRATVKEMAYQGLVELTMLKDPLSKGFEVLQFDPLTIKIKRDNHPGLPLTEFYDRLGNGLYLQTDEDEYERKIDVVLRESITLDFNLLVMNEIGIGNLKKALALAYEAFQWGQELSSSTLTCLLREVCESVSCVKGIIPLMEKTPKLTSQLDHETLNLLLQAFSKERNASQGMKIYEVMLQRHLAISDISHTDFLMCLCKEGSIDDFRMCWLNAYTDKWLPSIRDMDLLVDRLLQCKMLDQALELREDLLMAHPHLTSDVNGVFFQKLCSQGYTDVAQALVQRIQNEGYSVNHSTYDHITKGFIEEKKYSEALKIFDMMLALNMQPSLTVSVLVIPLLCKANQVHKALFLKTLCFKNYPVHLLVIYESLIKGLSKNGKTEEAAVLFHNMLADGVTPNRQIYNQLIQNCCQTSDLETALELFGIMIRQNVSLKIPSYGKFIELLCMKGKVIWALNIRRFMLLGTESLCLVTSNILLFHLFKSCNALYVDGLLSDLREKEILPDAVTYNYLVQGYCRSGETSKSLRNLMTMVSKELKPSRRILRMIIGSLCEEDMLEKALSISREMELRGWVHSSTVQYKLANGFLCRHNIQEAENFLHQIAEKGLVPDDIDYNCLIKKFCLTGRLGKAVDLVNIMLRRGNVPDLVTYEFIIHNLCTLGKLNQAMDFNAELLDQNLLPSDSTWGTLIQNICKVGNVVEAEELLGAMVRIGKIPTREMYSSVVKRYRSENNLVKASNILQAMQKYGYDPDFDMQWSLISNSASLKSGGKGDARFLSRLLSESGFSLSKKKSSTG